MKTVLLAMLIILTASGDQIVHVTTYLERPFLVFQEDVDFNRNGVADNGDIAASLSTHNAASLEELYTRIAPTGESYVAYEQRKEEFLLLVQTVIRDFTASPGCAGLDLVHWSQSRVLTVPMDEETRAFILNGARYQLKKGVFEIQLGVRNGRTLQEVGR